MEKIPFKLNVEIFGKIQPFSPTISFARVRIFYKGSNRNATYISEEFSAKLLSTIPYTPVKGIYKEEDKDFSDHGITRTDGHIYGVVPEKPNISWEKHLDDDGVEREYACSDVLLYTGLYPEAEQIPGSGQSMELYVPSITGEWKTVDGKMVYVYTDACFLGLQALGEATEPCFEGSQFFSLYKDLKSLIDEIKGGKRMIKFKLSDSAKFDKIFQQINPNYSEAGGWEIQFTVSEIYDSYALCYDYENGTFCRWYYQKDDSKDAITIGQMELCKVIDVSEDEYQALNLLKEANGSSFMKIDEIYTSAKTEVEELTNSLSAKAEEYDLQKAEAATKEADLSAKIESYTTKVSELEEQVTSKETFSTEQQEKINELEDFKGKIITAQKQNVITKYSKLLDEETLNEFKEKFAEFTATALEKELAFLAIEKNPNVFSADFNSEDLNLLPNKEENTSGAAKIIMKHKNIKTEE